MLKRSLFFLALILFYILMVNLVFGVSNINLSETSSKEKTDSEFLKADIGHSVSVTVERNRFYGKIIETDGISNIYLLGFVKLPLNSKKIDFRTFHRIFFGFISVFYLIVLFTVSKNKKQQRRFQHEMVR